jgi:hypothetical protein
MHIFQIYYPVMNIILILIFLFYGAVIAGFLLSCACFTAATKIRANLWILGSIFGILILNWIRFAIS